MSSCGGRLAGRGLLIGFVTGWLLAAVRNFSVALWVAIAGAREQLRMDQDFLDEI